ncbi:hypothetical protein predicted by Glimmer/Critica [Acetobacter ghanensis]|uniref:Uncharacterized protein n=1 Tax=Acetobacter ghanensis TaxID=431306 RepID=A0A0U5F5K8_9PROT|nr:hypothetical protein predicted by Glimmer/Critica [Acetobacter ghanensis]
MRLLVASWLKTPRQRDKECRFQRRDMPASAASTI